MRNTDNRLFLRRLLTVFFLVAGVWALWRLYILWLLAFGAILVAIILRAIASPLERRFSWSSRCALAAAVALIAITIALVVWLTCHAVSHQMIAFEQQFTSGWNRLKLWLQDSRAGEQVIATIENSTGRGVSKLPVATADIVGAILDIALVLFVGVFLAARPRLYIQGMLQLFPKNIRAETADLADNCGQALRLWMKGQLISMSIIGAMVTLGLWLIGLPSALALGVITGLANFVPVAGVIFAIVLSLLLALAQGVGITLETLAVFLAVQQVESNIIMPLVQQQVVMLPPALTLLSLMAFALLFGPFGLLVAVPLTVVAYVIVKRLYLRDTLGEYTEVPGEKIH